MWFRSLKSLGKLVCLVLPPVLAAPISVAVAQSGGLGSPELDDYILQKMDEIRTPGLAAVVVRDGEVLWAGGYGFADIERGIPVTPDTPFKLASISKNFTAAAVMRLWEEGCIGLDDDVSDYLPFPLRNPAFPDVPITFRMLLAHGSSIHDRYAGKFRTVDMDSPVSLEEFVGGYLSPDGADYNPQLNFLDAAPGEEFEYCRMGYALLAYLVERVTGWPFDLFCNVELFQPLNMIDTSWRIADFPDFSVAPAMEYFYDHTVQTYIPLGYLAGANYPSGALRTSAHQLAKWLIAHMNGGNYAGTQVLTSQSEVLMQTPVFGPFRGDYTIAWGLGFEVILRSETEEQLTIGHDGLDFGTATQMRYRPEQGVGVILLANSPGGILVPVGPQPVWGWQINFYDVLASHLLDEAAAAP